MIITRPDSNNSYKTNKMADPNPKGSSSNGAHGTNGYRSDSHSTTAAAAKGKRPSVSAPLPNQEKPAPAPKPNRAGVEETFKQFEQVLQAPQRPFATQHDDGTFGPLTKKGKLAGDLKHIGWQGT